MRTIKFTIGFTLRYLTLGLMYIFKGALWALAFVYQFAVVLTEGELENL